VRPCDGHVWLMQSEAQTTTRGILAVSAGALYVLLQYILRFRSGRTFLTFNSITKEVAVTGGSGGAVWVANPPSQFILFFTSFYRFISQFSCHSWLPYWDTPQVKVKDSNLYSGSQS